MNPSDAVNRVQTGRDFLRQQAVLRAVTLVAGGLSQGKAAGLTGLSKSAVQRLCAYIEARISLSNANPWELLACASEFARKKPGRPSRAPVTPAGPFPSPESLGRWVEHRLAVSPRLAQAVSSTAQVLGVPVGRKPYAVRLVRVTVVKRKHKSGFSSPHVYSDSYLLAVSPSGRRQLLYKFAADPDWAGVRHALESLRDLVVGSGLRVYHSPDRLFRSRRVTSALGRKNIVPIRDWSQDLISAANLTASRLRIAGPGKRKW